MRITKPQDFAAGLFFIAVAAAAYFTVPASGVGELAHLGPSGFPRITAGALGIIGVILAARSLGGERGEALHDGHSFVGIVILLAASLVFGLTFEHIGLFLSSAAAAWVSSWAHPRKYRWEAFVLSVGLAFFVSLIFVTGIGLQVDFWPDLNALSKLLPQG